MSLSFTDCCPSPTRSEWKKKPCHCQPSATIPKAMMVTACSDDQGAVCTKAPSLSPLLQVLEGKEAGPLKEKVGAYMTLAE